MENNQKLHLYILILINIKYDIILPFYGWHWRDFWVHYECWKLHHTTDICRVSSWKMINVYYDMNIHVHNYIELSCNLTPGCMSLFNCEIYQRERVSRVADAELLLLMAHLILRPGSITGVRWVTRNKVPKKLNKVLLKTLLHTENQKIEELKTQ